MKHWGLLAACACLAASAVAKEPEQAAPKLIVAISVDQFSADLFDQYRPVLLGGIGRLAKGTVFRNGYQSHNATETCPGHSTIMTGSRPSRTGIVANTWFDLSQSRSDKAVYCAEDERVAGSSTTEYTVSPYHLMVPTLGERLKAVQPGSRNVAVAGKDRAAVMMSGHNVDQRWYWSGSKFVTDLKGKPAPAVVDKANAAIGAALSEPRPPLDLPALCQSKAVSVPIENRDKPVGDGRFARNAEDVNAFRASPEFDGAILAVAAGLVEEMQLGRGGSTDVLSIGLSATDYVGHSYGTQGSEMCLQMLALDRELGDFLAFLDDRGIDYSVVLTADHGGLDIPERARGAGHPEAARIDKKLAAGEIGLDLVKELGADGFGLYADGNFGDVYADRSLPEGQRKQILSRAVATFRKHPQVEAVFTADQIAATPPPSTSPDKWMLIERARASYYPGRSGDFVVLLKRDITPIFDTSRYVATHGSPWDYDRRVPILFWRKGMTPSDRPNAVETVDIMPTLAASLGLPVDPTTIDGKCLGGVESISCPAR